MQMKDVRETIRGPDAHDHYIVIYSGVVCLTEVKTKYVWKMLVKKQRCKTE